MRSFAFRCTKLQPLIARVTAFSLNTQVLWTFSIYLEAVAILPQLVLLQRTQNIDNLTGNYVFLLGCVADAYMYAWNLVELAPVLCACVCAHR